MTAGANSMLITELLVVWEEKTHPFLRGVVISVYGWVQPSHILPTNYSNLVLSYSYLNTNPQCSWRNSQDEFFLTKQLKMQPQIESYDIFLKTHCCLLGTEGAFFPKW